MDKPFQLKVNDTYSFTLTEKEIKNLDLVKKDQLNYHILEDLRSFDIQVIDSDFNQKHYVILVNGTSYEVAISGALDALINKLGLAASATKKANDVKAPMPGLIVSVAVDEGQEVQEGDGILVLEAMKMENTLVAPKDGIVKSITVKAGDKVEKNELLIVME